MGFYDIAYYAIDNPVTRGVKNLVVAPLEMTRPSPVTVITEKTPLWKLACENGSYLRMASVLGASAVALGAYGAHRSYPAEKEAILRPVFETANRMHFFHSLAMLGVPMCRNPAIAGSLFLTGTILFSGPCYYYAFTGQNKLGKLAPVGGTILIIAWLSLAF